MLWGCELVDICPPYGLRASSTGFYKLLYLLSEVKAVFIMFDEVWCEGLV